MQMSPAEYVIKIFGGVRPTAKALGRNSSSVARWKRSKALGGCGGKIPSRAQQDILDVATKQKLDIKPADLLVGRNTRKRS